MAIDEIRLDSKGNLLLPNMFELGGGVYYIIKEMNGARRKISLRLRDFKKATRRYFEVMKELNDGTMGWETKRSPTLADYWTNHYRPTFTVLKTPLKTGAQFNDDNHIKQALRDLGAKRLDEITPTLAQRWANRRHAMSPANAPTKRIASGTVMREVALLKTIFRKAIADGLIENNPWSDVEKGSYAVRDRVLTLAEQIKLEEHLTPKFQRWLQFMLGTGLRLSEAIGIDPKRDVNLSERWVRVTRKTRGLVKKVQQVPLIDETLIDILEEQLAEEGQLWPQSRARFQTVLEDASEKAGIEHVNPHSLRHTFGTRYLQAGGDIYHLSLLLGHANVAITQKVYAHLKRDDLLEMSQAKGIKLGLRPAGPAKILAFGAPRP